jgi:hypothetical protein
LGYNFTVDGKIEGVYGINTSESFDVFTGTTELLSLFSEKYALEYA